MKLIDLVRVFLEPTNSSHPQCEALRVLFVEGLPSKEAAKLFGYTEGSFRVLGILALQRLKYTGFCSPEVVAPS